QIVDFLSGSKTYAKALTVINKIDLVDENFLKDLKTKIKSEYITVSADSNKNIDILKDSIYEKLNFMRIYMKPKGGETDYKEP
ncbi:MAG: GTP-binding protein, partial [Candidatus Dadabacteria bacterium]|nr:GTP-binding protein [Candidatus Dadabacteria bacterium]